MIGDNSMGYLYHGSQSSGIKRLEPHKSTHGNYIYATKYKELAIIFSKKAGDNLTYSLFRNSCDEPWQLVERIPSGLDLMFKNSASIYTVDDRTFKDIKTGFSELVSEVAVDVLEEEKIKNVYEKVKDLENKGLIKIYYYPDKPKNIPSDDSDLLYREFKRFEHTIENINHENFERLLLLHPQLLEKINTLALSKNPNFMPFKKEDLIDIFDKFVCIQKTIPTREQFLKSAIISISSIYPEFTKTLKKKLK